MTPLHRRNFIRLADFLDGPKPQPHGFDMRYFRCETECGTVCCALGSGPAAGIEKLQEGWVGYSVRQFGLDVWCGAWRWMFAGEWASTDNTPEGAAARIRVFLLDGVPKNWLDQMRRSAPLCYRTKSGKIKARFGHGRVKA